MARANRREEVLDAALRLFVERGYEGTSIGDIAAVVGVSKAAVSYHFPAKDDLLLALAEPPLRALEALVGEAALRGRLEGPALRDLLGAYVDVLLEHGEVASWLDADRGVLGHDVVGPRIAALHAASRRLLGGGDGGAREVASASALGALWRPVRILDVPLEERRGLLVGAAVAVLESVRG